MVNKKIDEINLAVVVVTYNRKDLLVRCLRGVYSQTLPPKTVYIVDNASTDGTYENLQENNLLSHPVINVKYLHLEQNCGGAGGFYNGLKAAHEEGGYDGYVLMDDDGLPDKDELKYIALFMDRYDYINASIDPLCKTITSGNCANYNYLAKATNKWWLLNGTNENSYEVYAVNVRGAVNLEHANTKKYLRVVIAIPSDVLYKQGDGTASNPYEFYLF